jgi:hypothetical protein
MTGITTQNIVDTMTAIINDIKKVRQYCKDNNLLNSQLYLDFEDELNKLSVLDPEQ